MIVLSSRVKVGHRQAPHASNKNPTPQRWGFCVSPLPLPIFSLCPAGRSQPSPEQAPQSRSRRKRTYAVSSALLVHARYHKALQRTTGPAQRPDCRGLRAFLEELASCMGCASNFVDALKERSLVTAVVITHQLAVPAVRERTGVLTGTAAGEVVIPPAPRLSLYQSCALRQTRHSQAPTRNSR